MSTISCSACSDLREYAPEYVMNGVTDTVATSLNNNSGFNPTLTVLHDNCLDLNNSNDCLIGRMPQELISYDVCDWKEYMGKFIPNLYEHIKAMIADGCGQWLAIQAACEKAELALGKEPPIFGALPYQSQYEYDANTGYANTTQLGRLTSFLVPHTFDYMVQQGLRYLVQNVGAGVCYTKTTAIACDGSTVETIELIRPFADFVTFSATPGRHDILWFAEKDECFRVLGCSERLWAQLKYSEYRFPDMFTVGRRYEVQLHVETYGSYGECLVMRYAGCTAPGTVEEGETFTGPRTGNVCMVRTVAGT